MLITEDPIQDCLLRIRGHSVLLLTDLARLYGAEPERLLTLARNFPGEFCFPLERSEVAAFADDASDRHEPTYVFGEHGALLVAFLLNTPRSIEMGIHVARAFVHHREV